MLDDFYGAFEALDLEKQLRTGAGAKRFENVLHALHSWALSFGRLFHDFSTLPARDASFEEPVLRFGARIESRLESALRETAFRSRPKRAPAAASLFYTVAEAVILRSMTELDAKASKRLLRETAVCLDAYVRARVGIDPPSTTPPGKA